jgi:hypothetical protein
VITATLILAVLFAAIGGYSWYTAPSLSEFKPAVRTQVVEKGIAGLSPAAAWKVWVNSYLTLARTGLQEFEDPNEAAIRQQISEHRFFAATMFVPAGIFLAAAGVAAVWRK